MKKSIRSEIDLLQKRRKDFGIQSHKEISTRKLKQKGIFIGSIFIFVGMISAISIGIYNHNLAKKNIELIKKAKEYDLLKSRFEEGLVSLRNIYETNSK